MFTIEQIKTAHAKVKSGADFPAYIQELKQLGVVAYETRVHDGSTEYVDADGNPQTSPATYASLAVADNSNADQFRQYLKAHQQGQSSYPAFCQQAADTGIEKWIVRLDAMTCTYYDKAGKEVLEERIS